MLSWLPHLPGVLASHHYTVESVPAGTAPSVSLGQILNARERGSASTVLISDDQGRVAGLLELIRRPDSLWINRLFAHPLRLDAALLIDLITSVQDATAELGLDALRTRPVPGVDWGVDWTGLGFAAHSGNLLEWRVFDSSDTLQATAAEALHTLPEYKAETDLEHVVPHKAPDRWIGNGELLAGGRFVVRELLGRGAMGEVWAADDTLLGSSVAIKVMKSEHVGRSKYRLRFEQEVRVTAQLDHPAVVTVLLTGQLPDQRIWFAMDRVRGDNLLQARHLFRPSNINDNPLRYNQWVRQASNIIEVVARAVASAHARGVVHRDIKPANIMVGRFSEVRLMDWGVARNLAEADAYFDDSSQPIDLSVSDSELTTRMGQRVGTPAYMAPEQARGEALSVGPPADVFCLGVTLFEMLTGELPVRRNVDLDLHELRKRFEQHGIPVPLRDAIEAATRPVAGDRPTAEAWALTIQRFLDGSLRREQADSLYGQTAALVPRVFELMAEAERTRRRAQAMLASVPRTGTADQRISGWRLEDEAARILGEAVALESQVERGLLSALELWDQHPPARNALADLYVARAKRADSSGSPGAIQAAESVLRQLHHPKAAAFLRARAAVTLVTDPLGAEVIAHRQESVDRLLTTVESIPLGRTPIFAHVLPRGSWILEIRSPGRAPVRYPVYLERGEHWHSIPPGGTEPFAVPLPMLSELGPEDCYIPAGWARLGGDPAAIEGIPAVRVWVDGMIARRYPVTIDEWFAWLDAASPDLPSGESGVWTGETGSTTGVIRHADGYSFSDHRHPKNQCFSGRYPMVWMSQAAAVAFTRWTASQTGLPWQLPTEWMWEKAARGVDGRLYSWGNHFDPSRANTAEQTGVVYSIPVDDHLDDISPYGVVHCCGQVREFCGDRFTKDGGIREGEKVPTDGEVPIGPDEWCNGRGGAFMARFHLCKVTNRFAARPGSRWGSSGLRLFALYGPKA